MGIKTARMVGNEGAEAIISGSVGPNAFEVLTQLSIKTYQMVPGTVEENLTLLSQGKLQTLDPSARGRRGGMGEEVEEEGSYKSNLEIWLFQIPHLIK
ncbi:NifB/NifX family molybdenum-iron cluster-binding protein [Methanobacterium petrolearium]|uniref:NifB/NifX family molybdenum-iron cluster-binding protein n=1 Tax=Methanobacterium petrolearium TaxID=710190 RepID=UPI00308154CB|nr:hypothetical protein GCM10025861_01930 [Methanobacterium petrolearium]